MPTCRIAVLSGDGVGQEVAPQAARAPEAAAARAGLTLELTEALIGGRADEKTQSSPPQARTDL